ncbi:MAG TPA: hypothetical protein DDZ80_12820 [Cyanobacteria bacterium UBA8803]|nr:hypothetical protein [Cyanobacteria bacterium UBA9273]HBL59357.1 hypothetical protein [Cyanobacteria bacterium UBA8803]
MSTSDVSSEVVELLSSLTGRHLTQDEMTPSVKFLAALAITTMGVMFADGTVEPEERQLLSKMIAVLVPPEGNVRHMMQVLVSGLEENPFYQNPQVWLKLTTSLSELERVLLLSLAFEMAAIDAHIDPKEESYLYLTANALEIDPRIPEVLNAWLQNQSIPDAAVWEELLIKLQPQQFEHLGIRLVSLDAVEIVSCLVGRRLSRVDITPSAVFLLALVMMTLGVMFADGEVQPEEQRLLFKTVNRLIPNRDDELRQWLNNAIATLESNPEYRHPHSFVKLTTALSGSEKLLALGFVYEMSAVDGIIDPKEKKYLQLTANFLEIDPRYEAVMAAGFGGEGIEDEKAFTELRSQLNPEQFWYLNAVFVDAAKYILDSLEVCSS